MWHLHSRKIWLSPRFSTGIWLNFYDADVSFGKTFNRNQAVNPLYQISFLFDCLFFLQILVYFFANGCTPLYFCVPISLRLDYSNIWIKAQLNNINFLYLGKDTMRCTFCFVLNFCAYFCLNALSEMPLGQSVTMSVKAKEIGSALLSLSDICATKQIDCMHTQRIQRKPLLQSEIWIRTVWSTNVYSWFPKYLSECFQWNMMTKLDSETLWGWAQLLISLEFVRVLVEHTLINKSMYWEWIFKDVG